MHLPSFPLSDDSWLKVAASLGLCERHAKIVKLVLLDASDQEIASAMGIAVSTLKTLLRRIRDRTKAPTRMRLAMRVLEKTVELLSDGHHPPGG
jgi:DNA-binding CsgD family transcriptional regulator